MVFHICSLLQRTRLDHPGRRRYYFLTATTHTVGSITRVKHLPGRYDFGPDRIRPGPRTRHRRARAPGADLQRTQGPCPPNHRQPECHGIGRNDRVAIVLPNGPDMAAAFVAIACGATTAPLNPAYRTEEFDFYLSDLNAKALVIQAGMESPAIDVAKARGIPIVRL